MSICMSLYPWSPCWFSIKSYGTCFPDTSRRYPYLHQPHCLNSALVQTLIFLICVSAVASKSGPGLSLPFLLPMTSNRLSSAISWTFLLLSEVHSRPCSATGSESHTAHSSVYKTAPFLPLFRCQDKARWEQPSLTAWLCLFLFADITVRDLPAQLWSLPQSLRTLKVETQWANFQFCQYRKHMLKSCDMSVNCLLAASVLLRTKLFLYSLKWRCWDITEN